MKERIGFVGLGLMGRGMVRNLLSAGFPVVGYDEDKNRMDALIGEGFQKAESPEEIPPLADVVILSLPNSHVVNNVVADSLKLFSTERKDLTLIDTTTADPVMSEELAVRLREKGIEMLDATISGTSKMCAEKDVTLMVGGREDHFEKCKPIFSALGKKIFYMGKNGSGALAKLVVNLVLGMNRMALAEGLCLAGKAGMDLNRTLEVLRESAAYSKAMDQKGQRMIEKDFLVPEGKLAFHLKDVQLMLDLGRRLNVPLVLSSLNAQALRAEVAKGRGDWDNADIISFYEDTVCKDTADRQSGPGAQPASHAL
jgi:3-hydroxyisobutyrate dehydrogenase-like beta-hydroxyacid dehydrogenase